MTSFDYASGMAAAPTRSIAMPVSVVMFGLGLLAIVAVVGLSASGYHDLPLWLNLLALLAPLGFAVGLITMIVRRR
jgi:uncharacterized membrane protein YhdT